MASREERQAAIREASRLVRVMNLRGSGLVRAASSTTIELASLVDVEDVEVCQTGIEYNLASGPRTFTTDDLKDAVESQNDAAVKVPRLKLGHDANIGILADGQPAIGTVTDMHLVQGGHTIMGTYKQIPEWLATILPSAYPARSIEGATEVTTNTGNSWQLVITDLALLGVVWPGVSTLDDIQALYSKEGPGNLKVLTTKEEVAKLSVAASALVTAQVDVDNIMRGYREQKDSSQMWWWVRSMMIDPNELIVEDEDSGDLYRVPWAVKGDDVTFEEPIPVKIVYKDKPKPKEDKQAASLAAAAAIGAWSSLNPGAKQIASFQSREESMSSGIATETDPVALRSALGLEESATDDEVRAALTAAGIIAPPGGGSGVAPAGEQPGTLALGGEGQPDVTSPGGPTDPATATPNVTPAAVPPASPAGAVTPPTAPSTVTFDAATAAQLQRDAALGRTAYQRQIGEDRDKIIDAAIKAGKIPPSRIDHWRKQWESDETGTKTLLTAAADKGGLVAGLIPVTTIGGENPTEDTTVEAYPADWFPEIAAAKSPGGLTS